MTFSVRKTLARWAGRCVAASLAATLWGAHAKAPAPACPPEAQPFTEAQLTAGERQARDRGFLWRITKDGRTSWLYGTIHIGRPDWSFVGPKVSEALRGSNVLALEMDLTDPAIVQRAAAAMALKPGRGLPAPMHARLLAQTRAACLPDSLVSQMDPEMLGVTLVVRQAQRSGLDAAFGVDAILAQKAKAGGQRIVSLESPEAQLALLISTDRTDMLATMARVLRELEQGTAVPPMQRLANAWEAGNDPEMLAEDQRVIATLTPHERQQMRALLHERNPGLADGIDALHGRGEQVFAAVGSLHLLGPDSVPALLARRGYDVQRVSLPSP